MQPLQIGVACSLHKLLIAATFLADFPVVSSWAKFTSAFIPVRTNQSHRMVWSFVLDHQHHEVVGKGMSPNPSGTRVCDGCFGLQNPGYEQNKDILGGNVKQMAMDLIFVLTNNNEQLDPMCPRLLCARCNQVWSVVFADLRPVWYRHDQVCRSSCWLYKLMVIRV